MIAGAYPGNLDPAQAEANVRALIDAGVTLFVNLMEVDETFPIPDLGVPNDGRMQAIQNAIDAELEAGGRVYVHCWGGRGRTGTGVGAHLIRHGQADPDDFVEVIARRRVADESGRDSPENPQQVAFVRLFVERVEG